MTHILIDMPDMVEANLLPHLERAVHFIKSALDQSSKVLVHCQAGVSRSASVSPEIPFQRAHPPLCQALYWLQIVLAYLMAMEKIGVEAALASLRQTYPYACPNEGVPACLNIQGPAVLCTDKVCCCCSAITSCHQAMPSAGFLHQLQLWHEMQYAFKPNHPGYTTVMMQQLAMRYDAGEELSSITNDLAVPSEAAAQVHLTVHTKKTQMFVF